MPKQEMTMSGEGRLPREGEPLTDEMLNRIAREIALNVVWHVESMYPDATTAAPGLVRSLRGCVHNEVTKWFGHPDPAVALIGLDGRLRASAAHRRHMQRMRKINGTIEVGDPIDPILAAMDASAEQARLDYRAGGPVIEGDVG